MKLTLSGNYFRAAGTAWIQMHIGRVRNITECTLEEFCLSAQLSGKSKKESVLELKRGLV